MFLAKNKTREGRNMMFEPSVWVVYQKENLHVITTLRLNTDYEKF